MKRHCEEEQRKPARLPTGNLHVLTAEKLLRCACLPTRRTRNEVFALLLVLISLTSNATIHTVKQDGSGDYTTIQEGINAASTGDTVLVWPGTYFENIDYNSKSITVGSLFLTTGIQNYINTTTIDGANNGSCVVISNSTGNNTTLCGLTIQHGSGYANLKRGGGIYIESSNLTIKNCIIKDNIARTGGGIYSSSSTIYLKGSTIKNNWGLYSAGGILMVNGTQLYFDQLALNSIYLNYGPKNGSDVRKSASCPALNIKLDTGTVLLPDYHFYYSYNTMGYPVDDISWQINNGKILQTNSDLYVSPYGDNTNSGISQNSPLKTISFAIKKILPDTNDPKSIFLSEGKYSPSSNNEVFPIVLRSYVSLNGAAPDITIIDAETQYPLFDNYIGIISNNIKNIKFQNGIDTQSVNGGNGGLDIFYNENIVLTEVIVDSVKGSFRAGINCNFSNITIYSTKIKNSSGGYPIALLNSGETLKQIHLTNSYINKNGPGSSVENGIGGAVGLSGTYSYPNSMQAILNNVLISDNTSTFENGTINFGICGISCTQNAKVDVINTIIVNNIVTNPVPSAQVYATEGAEINFYNSIIYGTEDYEIFLGDGTPTSDIATVNISNSDVKGGEENIQNWNNIHTLNWLDGNIDEDPLWEGGEPFSYTLQPGSPCIDAGVPMYEVGMDYPYIKEQNGKYVLYMLEGDTVTLPAYDLAGNPRISGGRIDMGAYEWQDTVTEVQKFRVQSSGFGVYPNPFTSNVFVSFSLKKEAEVRLEVINIKGQPVKTVADASFPAGNFKLTWNGKDENGYAVKKGNYLMCLYINEVLVECEKLQKAVSM